MLALMWEARIPQGSGVPLKSTTLAQPWMEVLACATPNAATALDLLSLGTPPPSPAATTASSTLTR